MRVDRMVSACVLLAPTVLIGGCLFGSSEEGDGGRPPTPAQAGPGHVGGSGGADAVSDGPPPEPSAVELVGLVHNSEQWAGLLVTLRGARVIAGREDRLASFSGWEEPRLDPYRSYAELDLEIVNLGEAEVDLEARDTWDLLLADGSRVESVDSLGVRILPGDAATTVLHYELEVGRQLDGAAIQLEGSERGEFEPARIALDEERDREFPRRLDGVVGQVLETAWDRVEIDEAMWDLNCQFLRRARRDKRCLWLHLAVTAKEDQHWSGDESRLSVDGRGLTPIEWDHRILDHDETFETLLAFEVDAGADKLELRLGLHGTHAEYELVPLSVDVSASTLAPLPLR